MGAVVQFIHLTLVPPETEGDPHARFTRLIHHPQINVAIPTAQFDRKGTVVIWADHGGRPDFEGAHGIGAVEDKERAFRMTLQILGLLPGCVERQLDEAILIVVQKPEGGDLWIAVTPNRREHSDIGC